jgi:hypothetical protein
MHPLAGTIAIVSVIAIISFTVLEIVKAIIGSRAAQWGKDGNTRLPPMFEKMFEKAVADRDEKLLKMEARLRVLEQIVTDNYGSKKLAAEIDKLGDERA